jgi:hypothetical protein
MPASDRHHDPFKRALVKDGWQISDEQVKIVIGERNLFIDIEAFHADGHQVILIEIKELNDVKSPVEALAHALGKYQLYQFALRDEGIDTPLYLAITTMSYKGIISERIGQLVKTGAQIALIVFDPLREEIVQWIP